MAVRTLSEIQDIVSRLARQYGARGDMNEDSDIDLRIDKGAIQGLQLAGLLLDLEDSLGVSVDLIPTTSLEPHFLESIHNDEVLLYEAS